MSEMRFDRAMRQRQQIKDAEADGRVADSMEVRKALIARFDSGGITLEQMQAELKCIKQGAKAAGKVTRDQAFRGY